MNRRNYQNRDDNEEPSVSILILIFTIIIDVLLNRIKVVKMLTLILRRVMKTNTPATYLNTLVN